MTGSGLHDHRFITDLWHANYRSGPVRGVPAVDVTASHVKAELQLIDPLCTEDLPSPMEQQKDPVRGSGFGTGLEIGLVTLPPLVRGTSKSCGSLFFLSFFFFSNGVNSVDCEKWTEVLNEQSLI